MQKEEILTSVTELITDYLRLDADELKPESHIVNDMGADSLALVELGFKFSDTFGIGMINPDDDMLIISNLVDHIHREIAN